jgi:hypothetical protein
VRGERIVQTSWAGNAAFAVTALPLVFGLHVGSVAIGTALALFALSLFVWAWAFAVAVRRSTEGDDIVVGSLFLLQGDVDKRVRKHLYASCALCVVITAVTAKVEPFGVLVPMLPIGLVGLWGAKYGTFPLRTDVEVPVRPLRPDRPSQPRGGSTRRASGGRAGK